MLSYKNLLIKQYYDKPKARAEIDILDKSFTELYNLFLSFDKEYDLDFARGRQLDKIGKIVGISRIVPKSLPKIYFGFSENPNSLGFGDRFNPTVKSAPFFDKESELFTATELNDDDFRFFIKAKVALNYCSAAMVSDERISMQEVIQKAFNGQAYIVDNKDMTLTLFISPLFDLNKLELVKVLNLLPKPQAVRYDIITQADAGLTFGFTDNPNSKGFADRFDPFYGGGLFANKITL